MDIKKINRLFKSLRLPVNLGFTAYFTQNTYLINKASQHKTCRIICIEKKSPASEIKLTHANLHLLRRRGMTISNLLQKNRIPMNQNEGFIMKLIKLQQVIEMTGLARATIYKHIDNNWFPKQIPLGGRSVAWLESEVLEWILERIKDRDTNA